jgi:hypothetical protein
MNREQVKNFSCISIMLIFMLGCNKGSSTDSGTVKLECLDGHFRFKSRNSSKKQVVERLALSLTRFMSPHSVTKYRKGDLIFQGERVEEIVRTTVNHLTLDLNDEGTSSLYFRITYDWDREDLLSEVAKQWVLPVSEIDPSTISYKPTVGTYLGESVITVRIESKYSNPSFLYQYNKFKSVENRDESISAKPYGYECDNMDTFQFYLVNNLASVQFIEDLKSLVIELQG